MEETITISREEYEKLSACRDKLYALEAAGVDNWEGYSYALEIMGDDENE